MLKLTETIIESKHRGHIFTSEDLIHLLDGTPSSRYGAINKALKKQEIIRLHRGIYILNKKYLTKAFSKFYLASRIQFRSYVSLESALSFHGWIPERISAVMNVTAQTRSKSVSNDYGEFNYYHIPVNNYEFLTGVQRFEEQGQPFLLATPLRALTDLIYVRKIEKINLDYLINSLRIEFEDLLTITQNEIFSISNVYRSKRVLDFLTLLQQEILDYE